MNDSKMIIKVFLSYIPVPIVFICLAMSLFHPTYSQEVKPADETAFRQSSLFLELGGNARFYSFNYDYRFARKFSVRVGISAIPDIDFNRSRDIIGFVVAPLMLNYLSGRDKHFFEAGLGVLLGPPLAGDPNVTPTVNVGYRGQPADRGFMFRAGLNSFIDPSNLNLSLGAGLSFGYTFNRHSKSSYSQQYENEDSPRQINHRVYLELAGNGGFYSFNYEYGLTDRLSARAGFEIFPLAWTEDTGTVMGFPLMLNYRLYSIRNHHLLAGAGTLLATNGVVTATAMLAYELHVANKSMLRLGFTPHMIEGSLEPWGGLSVGFIF